jgi:hypothetical protein
MAFQVLYGLESQRPTTKLKIAELLYTVDTQRLYIGDGITMGGNPLKSGELDDLSFSKEDYLPENSDAYVPSQRAIRQFVEEISAGYQSLKGVAGAVVPTRKLVVVNPTSPIFTLTLPEIKQKNDPTYAFDQHKFPGESVTVFNASDTAFVNIVASDGTVLVENMAPGGCAYVSASDSPNTWVTQQAMSPDGVSNTTLTGYVPDPNKLPVVGAINTSTNKFELYIDSDLATSLLGLGTLAFKNLVENIDIADDAVGTTSIQDLAITGDKIADNSVTGNKLADSSVTGNKLADNTVDGFKIKDSAITGDKIAPNTITGDNILFDSISVDKLSDIATAKITAGPNSYIFGTIDLTTGRYDLELDFSRAGFGDLSKLDKVGTGDFENGAVTGYAIGNKVIETSHIADGAIDTEVIADEAITEDTIANEAVTTPKIADENVTTRKLADQAVTTEKIGEEQVTASKMANDSVTTRAIEDLAVTTEKIRDRAVTNPKLADGAVDSRVIADGGIQEQDIASGAISTRTIANGAITKDKVDYASVFNDSGVQTRLQVEYYDPITSSGSGGNFSGSFSVSAGPTQGRVIVASSYSMAPANDGDSEHSASFTLAKLRLIWV